MIKLLDYVSYTYVCEYKIAFLFFLVAVTSYHKNTHRTNGHVVSFSFLSTCRQQLLQFERVQRVLQLCRA